MHAESTAFLCCDSAELFGILQIPRGAKCHRVRKDRSSKEMGWKDASFKSPAISKGRSDFCWSSLSNVTVSSRRLVVVASPSVGTDIASDPIWYLRILLRSSR